MNSFVARRLLPLYNVNGICLDNSALHIVDIDECKSSSLPCVGVQYDTTDPCTDTIGSYSCNCAAGYTHDPSDNTLCIGKVCTMFL